LRSTGEESRYFIDLIKKGIGKQKVQIVQASFSLKRTREIYLSRPRIKEEVEIKNENKENKIKIERLTPMYGGYKKGILLNDNKNAFDNIIEESKKIKEFLALDEKKWEQNIETSEITKNLVRRKEINKVKKIEYCNIIKEKNNNIESRKLENKLKSINYYFTPRYVSRSMTTQLRSWPNTIYSYIKGTIRNIKYKDMMASKVIKIFMNPTYIRRKIVQGEKGEKKGVLGISIKAIKILSKYINEVIKYTSQRSRQEIKNIENYSKDILTLPWIKKEIGWARNFRKYLKERRSGMISGYMPKRKVMFNKTRKMYISKPLFKHTVWNVIIDLYVYNNKSYKLGKYHNMLKLRALYKYMYSMYVNYKEIIQKIILRPRIFYINLIEPKINNYYWNVIDSYEKLMIHMSKKEFLYLILNILKWNYSNKIWYGAININKLLKNWAWYNDNSKERERKLPMSQAGQGQELISSSFGLRKLEFNRKNENSFGKLVSKKRVIKDNKEKNINRIKWVRLKNNINKYRSIYNKDKKNIFINNYINLINNKVIKISNSDIRNKIRTKDVNIEMMKESRKLSRWDENYFLLKEHGANVNKAIMRKQYLLEQEKKYNTVQAIKGSTVNDSYTLAPNSSRNNINKKKFTSHTLYSINKEKDRYKKGYKEERRVKIFGKDKLTLKNFKRKITKGKKYSKLDPKFWKEQTMKYNLYGVTQKANKNPNQKWVYDNKTKIKVHINKYLDDKQIFDKIKKRKERKQILQEKQIFISMGKIKKRDYKENNNNEYIKNKKFYNKIAGVSDKLYYDNKINKKNKESSLYGKGKSGTIHGPESRFQDSNKKYKNERTSLNNKWNKNISNNNINIKDKSNQINNSNKRKLHTLNKIRLNIKKNKNNNKINNTNSKNEINYLGIKKFKGNKILLNKGKIIENNITYYSIENKSNRKQKINYIKYLKDLYLKDKETKNMNLYFLDDLKLKIGMQTLCEVNISQQNKKDKNKDIHTYNFLNYKNNISWDKLDYSIMKMLKKRTKVDVLKWQGWTKSFTENINKENKVNKKNNILSKFINYSYEKIVKKINNSLESITNSDKLYIDIIKQDFYNVNRDVMVSKSVEVFDDEYNSFNNLYNYQYNNRNIYDNLSINFKEKGNYTTRIWQTLNFNSKEESIMNNLRFSDNVFKPYYRYMIRIFILNEYKNFIKKLGYKNIIIHYYLPMLYEKLNWFRENNLKLLNFIGVRTLFNLFAFNYRSLYIIKPKYYYINKYRYYKRKATRLKYNTWLRSIKYLKGLRKAPKSYWLRYHRLINYYYAKIINYAKWDTERKILMPYVLYFEDILYNIYGKLAIIRIWPLKRYFLSSYILSERLMLLLDKKANWSKRRKSITGLFTRFVFKFINILKASKIEKIYDYNLENNSRWPNELINIFNKDLPIQRNYNKLEYYSKKLEASNLLSTYLIKNGELDNYLPLIKFFYYNLAKNTYLKIKRWKKNKYKLLTSTKKGLIKYWTRPIKNFIVDITNNLDISGVEFRLAGRAKSKARAFSLIYQYGSFLGAKHYNKVTHKYLTLSSYYLRNTLKSTMDYTQKAGNYGPGTTNLKLTYSSLLGSDIMELLSYLIKMKEIYIALINRNFIVHSNIKYFTKYYKWNRYNTRKVLNYFRNNKYKFGYFAHFTPTIKKLNKRKLNTFKNKIHT